MSPSLSRVGALAGVDGGDHFVPFDSRGSTVSGRHWYSGTVPLIFATCLPWGVKAWLTATVRAALHHRSASYICSRCHSPPHSWLLTSHVRAHNTHAPSAEAAVASASNHQNTAPMMRAQMAAIMRPRCPRND